MKKRKILHSKLKVGTEGGMVAVSRDMKVVDSFPHVAIDRKQMVAAVKDFVWNHSGDLSLKDNPRPDSESAQADGKKDSVAVQQHHVRTASRKEIISRYNIDIKVTNCVHERI